MRLLNNLSFIGGSFGLSGSNSSINACYDALMSYLGNSQLQDYYTEAREVTARRQASVQGHEEQAGPRDKRSNVVRYL